jgi:hypothetical protein
MQLAQVKGGFVDIDEAQIQVIGSAFAIAKFIEFVESQDNGEILAKR